MARLLIVHHSPTRSTRALFEAALAGANDDEIEGVEVVVRQALEATAGDVLGADGYLLGSPVNFGYMSGALKHFFDSTFLAVGGSLDPSGGAAVSTRSTTGGGSTTEGGGETSGRPYGLWMHGRYDLTGGVRAVQSIVGALGWRQSYDVLEVLGDVGDREGEAAYELGATIAALLTG